MKKIVDIASSLSWEFYSNRIIFSSANKSFSLIIEYLNSILNSDIKDEINRLSSFKLLRTSISKKKLGIIHKLMN